jgi:methionyl-tRNA synthetase
MSGFDVFYLTGTDEHGMKIERRALEAGKTPQEFVDALVADLKRLWKTLDISYDKYIRTTDAAHKNAVREIFRRLIANGDVYKGTYRGKYCTPCESFWTASQLKDGKCPDCGREVADAEEECYFFRLSKYGDKIKRLLTRTDFLEPASRVNEMVNNFIDAGLEDLAVSRTSFKWGIPVPDDDGHVVYVWIDALTNYITALGYGSGDTALFDKYWPADLHMMAKEIVRFHSIIWPAILMSLNLPLPKKIYGHGWILFDGDKMSKSKGNVVDPFVLSERYGVDALRYFLLREISFGQDSGYSSEQFLTRVNADLANDYGNLAKRTLAMAAQYFNGEFALAGAEQKTEFDAALAAKIDGLFAAVTERMDNLNINRALEAVFEVIGAANKYIDLTKPWELNRGGEKAKLQNVIYNLAEALRVSSVMLMPFLTRTPQRVFAALGVTAPTDFKSARYGAVKKYKTTEIETLFKRVDIKKELADLAQTDGGTAPPPTDKPDKKENADKAESRKENEGMITIDEFFKTELRAATVTAAERVEKSDKLIKITLDVGGETRTVVSGIAKYYAPEELIGKQVVLVYNLAPAKLRGIESQGMLLCADDGENVVLISPEKAVKSGAKVC